ncbi:eukaryotic translation initiation factor 3 subunit J-B isoform X1 [Alosa alosa]|uniref:eukaryotic translation initiation factor 3 subunit J-B isoform X1 n=1 Tax=Alosa sapidissima TaxID=34773 RepID=UPI001C08835F|nr:eukaryotic translation initiation factor 3 subunit J-B isoform X1 [Alosa sapidissima]XP_048087251.1 eukaryotic translation initiation factor 3 subunit J-B isoform X1 [Alosa alosa]
MADSDSWDAENFEPTESATAKKPVALLDKWEGEDEDEDVKDNWDDEEEEGGEPKAAQEKTETKVSEKKKLNEKIKEKERKQQEELRKRCIDLKASQEAQELTAEEQAAERLRQKKAQEEADMELAREAFGVESNAIQNSVSGIDALNPSSREDFVEFEKLLREKITQYDKSIHYSTFLESLFRELCISLELEDLKKVSTSLTVLLNEKQKQEKQLAKGKKKKKTNLNLAGGGLKAKKKDDLDDYGGFGAGYEQDYEDFM